MNSENIFEGISYIDDALIERSAAVLKKRRFVVAAKLAAGAAAALALVFGGGAALYNIVLVNMTSDSQVPPVLLVEIGGAGYCQEGFHTGDIRKAYGLSEPSEQFKGEFIGSFYVKVDADEIACFDFFTINADVNGSVILGELNGELSYWMRAYSGESARSGG